MIEVYSLISIFTIFITLMNGLYDADVHVVFVRNSLCTLHVPQT